MTRTKQAKAAGKKPARKPKAKSQRGPAVKAPAAESVAMRSDLPRIDRGKHSIRVRHRELVGAVSNNSEPFAVTQVPLNPAMAVTFPWLSTQAEDWEQYTFHSLVFEYLPRCSTTQVGSIIMAPDYDALDVAPASETVMSSYYGAVEDAQWRSIACHLDKPSMHPLGPRKFIRTGPVPGDLKTYDVGTFYLATTSTTDTNAVGRLWVNYDVELFIPQKQQVDAAQRPSNITWMRPDWVGNQVFINATPDTLNVAPSTSVNALGAVATGFPGVFTLPAGTYLLEATVGVNDNATEPYDVYGGFAVNGTQLVGQGQFNVGPFPDGGFAVISTSAVVAVTASDSIAFVLTFTSTIGTVTAQQASTCIIISAA
jgi:hypothetical protein